MTDDDPNAPVSEDDLHSYCDGRLDAGRERAVLAHLDAHPEDAREIARWRANEAALSALLSGCAHGGPDDIPAPARSRRRDAWPVIAAALIAAFGLGGGAGFVLRDTVLAREDDSAAQSGWLEAAARDVFLTYVGEVRHPVEVGASEREHLVNWLGNRIERPFTAPSLEALGFSLVGGRLLPLGGHPGAMLMYENASGERATLLLARNGGARDTAFQFSADAGVNTFRWIEESMAYAISGLLDRAALEDIARAVHAHFETI